MDIASNIDKNLLNINHKLGSGVYSKVYKQTIDGKTYAIKIPSGEFSEERSKRYFNIEVNNLNNFRGSPYLLNLIDYKIDDNDNIIILELLGDELYKLIKYYDKYHQNIPFNAVKHFSLQILYGLKELKEKNIYHNDLKPENILFTKPLQKIFKTNPDVYCRNIYKIVFIGQFLSNESYLIDNPLKNDVSFEHIESHILYKYDINREILLLNSKVKIVDFGLSFTNDRKEDDGEYFSERRPTRNYTAPEWLLGIPHWVELDMWSFGCILYFMLTNEILFWQDRDNTMGINSCHLLRITELLGPAPSYLIEAGKKAPRYYTVSKKSKNNTSKNTAKDYVHRFNYLKSKRNNFNDLLYHERFKYCDNATDQIMEQNITNTKDILLKILTYDKDLRLTPEQCINESWFSLKPVFKYFC